LPADIYRLKKSVEHFGLLRPLVLNKTTETILDGDRLLSILRDQLPMDAKVPCWIIEIPAEEEDAAHLALNNHCGEWQWQAVSDQLKSVVGRGIEPTLTGFHDYDIQPLLAADWSPAAKGPLDGSDAAQASLL